jgi:anti-sigma B factor antagonist
MDADYLDDELMPEPHFKHSEEADDAGRVLMQLEGELDMLIGPSLAKRFHELAEEGGCDVVVDLTDARFIDTTVLTAFVTAQRELEQRDHKLAVVAGEPYARRTFELTGLGEQLHVCCSRDEALALLAR